MWIKKWEALPPSLQNEQTREYYEILRKKQGSLLIKRGFDILASTVLLALLSPTFLALSVAIKMDSPGPVFYRQTRVTQYGREFRIHKFRSMVDGADRKGSLVTVKADDRVTRVGAFIRKYRLDELCQLLDVLAGTMTFVGTRPEVPRYVEAYTPEMMATLLLPAGVTSLASIFYKDESDLLDGADDPDEVYVNMILPEKMRYNLSALREFGLWQDLKTMAMTVFAVCGVDYQPQKEEGNA